MFLLFEDSGNRRENNKTTKESKSNTKGLVLYLLSLAPRAICTFEMLSERWQGLFVTPSFPLQKQFKENKLWPSNKKGNETQNIDSLKSYLFYPKPHMNEWQRQNWKREEVKVTNLQHRHSLHTLKVESVPDKCLSYCFCFTPHVRSHSTCSFLTLFNTLTFIVLLLCGRSFILCFINVNFMCIVFCLHVCVPCACSRSSE